MRLMNLLGTVILLMASPVWPQAQTTAEDATRAYFDALQKEGMSVVTRFTHPDELDKFKSLLLPLYEAEESAGESELLEATYGADSTLDMLRRSTGADFMNRFLGLFAAQLEAAGGIDFEGVEILGSVPEGEDVVHVVARTSVGVGEVAISKVQVVSWRAHGNEWLAVLSGEMEGLAQQLRSQLSP